MPLFICSTQHLETQPHVMFALTVSSNPHHNRSWLEGMPSNVQFRNEPNPRGSVRGLISGELNVQWPFRTSDTVKLCWLVILLTERGKSSGKSPGQQDHLLFGAEPGHSPYMLDPAAASRGPKQGTYSIPPPTTCTPRTRLHALCA